MGRLIGCTCRAGMAGLISMSNLKTSQGALWPGIASVKPYGAECLTGCSARFGVLGSFMLVGHKHAPVSVNEALHKQRWAPVPLSSWTSTTTLGGSAQKLSLLSMSRALY